MKVLCLFSNHNLEVILHFTGVVGKGKVMVLLSSSDHFWGRFDLSTSSVGRTREYITIFITLDFHLDMVLFVAGCKNLGSLRRDNSTLQSKNAVSTF